MKDKSYRLHKKNGITYVLTQSRIGEDVADFMGTGMALAGIAKENELQEFIEKQPLMTEKNLARNTTLRQEHDQREYHRRKRESLTLKVLSHE